MEIVLVHPQIPHNTGCIARTAAATGVRLHLVEPLGYSLEDRYLKRAGLDYWPLVDLFVHRDWGAAAAHLSRGSDRDLVDRLRPFSARGGTSLFESRFRPDDVLLFGCESHGLPEDLLERAARGRVYIPVREGVRSLNLASAACVGLYTAMVAAGLPLPDNDGVHSPHPRQADGLRPTDVARHPEP
ncbi:tRNA (cytidine(34)-2'-O)-methyltransferase [Planctomycetes bacterium Pla163]|uniref:Putative tRNA (cytidine(34)-2'-O)-methyltransferase n=1 Tax=Rohdeia mirabilis TaxID=2528008 RepID=A0A518CX88_9BACT|nr:tRNA (cytidine(34)-2'-O)-methyltransferase [Planctomycetes bacterium Pla163]